MISNTHDETEPFDVGSNIELNAAFQEARYQLDLLAILREKADFLHKLATGGAVIVILSTSSLTFGVLDWWRANFAPANISMIWIFIGLVTAACVIIAVILIVRSRTALQKRVIEAEIDRLHGSLRNAEREVQRLRRQIGLSPDEFEQ